MKKNGVKVGETYTARVSGKIVPVTILRERGSSYDHRTNRDRHLGWDARNDVTGREVHIRSAQRLRVRAQSGDDEPMNFAQASEEWRRISASRDPQQ